MFTHSIAVVFNYSLWSLCNVEPVTEACESSSFELPEQDLGNPICTEPNLNEVLYRNVICRTEFIDSLQTALLATEGCQDEANQVHAATIQGCAVNEENVYCLLLPDAITSLDAPLRCRNTDVCDPLCIETLNNRTRDIGCCFISLFNETDDTPDYLSWQRCGLTSPGFCCARFITSSTSSTNVSTTTAAGTNPAEHILSSGQVITTFAVVLLVMALHV